jgi:HEAT repeat protein
MDFKRIIRRFIKRDKPEAALLAGRSRNPALEKNLSVIRALGESRNPIALAPLVAQLLNEHDWNSHEAAAEALGNLGDPCAIPALMSVLRSNERQGGSEVARALGRIGAPALQPLLDALKATDDHVMRRAITHALIHMGSPAVEALIELVPVQGPVGDTAIIALGWIKDPRAVDPLLAILATSKDKSDIIEALGNIGDPRAIDPLIGLIDASGPYNHKRIIQAFYLIGDKRLLPVLQDLKKKYRNQSGEKDIQYWLNEAIDKIESPESHTNKFGLYGK